MTTEKLYNYGFIVADIGRETEDQCETRVIAALELLDGVHRAERIPHMIAMDKVGEVSLAIFVEIGTDLDALEKLVEQIPGVTYRDLTEDPVRISTASVNPPCGQPGHQCACGTGTPKP